MAKKEPTPDAGAEKQRPLEDAKNKADQSGPYGKQPNEKIGRASCRERV